MSERPPSVITVWICPECGYRHNDYPPDHWHLDGETGEPRYPEMRAHTYILAEEGT